jgi:hypothetical protein
VCACRYILITLLFFGQVVSPVINQYASIKITAGEPLPACRSVSSESASSSGVGGNPAIAALVVALHYRVECQGEFVVQIRREYETGVCKTAMCLERRNLHMQR